MFANALLAISTLCEVSYGVTVRFHFDFLVSCFIILFLHYFFPSIRISLITACQKMRAMNDVLSFFALNEWRFSTENVKKLNARLSPDDRAIYNLDPKTIQSVSPTNMYNRYTKHEFKAKKKEIIWNGNTCGVFHTLRIHFIQFIRSKFKIKRYK